MTRWKGLAIGLIAMPACGLIIWSVAALYNWLVAYGIDPQTSGVVTSLAVVTPIMGAIGYCVGKGEE